MSTRETLSVRVAGHEFRLEVDGDERVHIDRAAEQVTERIRKLTEKAGSASPSKIAAMVAFQFACDLSIANELLDEAESLHEELKRQKAAVARLEELLGKVDNALAY